METQTEGGQPFDMDALVSKITENVTQKIGESNQAFEARIKGIEDRFSTPVKEEKPANWDYMDDDERSKYQENQLKSYTDQKFEQVNRTAEVTKAIIAADDVAKSLGFSGELAPYAVESAKRRLVGLAQSNPALIEALADPNNKEVAVMRQDLIDVAQANAAREHQKVVQDRAAGYHKEGNEDQDVEKFMRDYEKSMGRPIDKERALRLMKMEDM